MQPNCDRKLLVRSPQVLIFVITSLRMSLNILDGGPALRIRHIMLMFDSFRWPKVMNKPLLSWYQIRCGMRGSGSYAQDIKIRTQNHINELKRCTIFFRPWFRWFSVLFCLLGHFSLIYGFLNLSSGSCCCGLPCLSFMQPLPHSFHFLLSIDKCIRCIFSLFPKKKV